MSCTHDLGIALTKEQLCKLVLEFYGEALIPVTPPYSRFEALKVIALLEQKSSNTLQQVPYYDEMQDFYSQEFDFVKTKVLDIQSPKALQQVNSSLKISRYKDVKLMQSVAFAYKMLTNYDIEVPPKIQTLYDVSEIIQCFTYYNVSATDIYKDFIT